MKTKIVYVLVSNPKDIYLEQAFVSLASLRHHMGKDVTVNLLTDTITYKELDSRRMKMLKDIDEIITVDLPADWTAQNRSRMLKTSCRKHVKGDFLFIDCDTIILSRLDDIDNISANIAACYDSHSLFQENPYYEMCCRHCKKLGNDISKEEVYYNSGVIYVKDNPATHKFYDKWNENWLKGREKGVNMDQPAFNKTNIELGYPIKCLNDIWNCEFIHGIRFLKDAKILHYLCTNTISKKNKASFLLRDKEVLMNIKETGVISENVRKCFDDPFQGIPPLTKIIAGEELYMQRTPLYQALHFRYNTPIFNVLNSSIIRLKKILGK